MVIRCPVPSSLPFSLPSYNKVGQLLRDGAAPSRQENGPAGVGGPRSGPILHAICTRRLSELREILKIVMSNSLGFADGEAEPRAKKEPVKVTQLSGGRRGTKGRVLHAVACPDLQSPNVSGASDRFVWKTMLSVDYMVEMVLG